MDPYTDETGVASAIPIERDSDGRPLVPVNIPTPNIYKTALVTASGNAVVWLPTSGKRFRLMRYQFELSANVAAGAAGTLPISFYDNATAMNITHDPYVPASAIAAPIGDGYISPWFDLGIGYLSASGNAALNVQLGRALTSGSLRVNIAGVEI